MSSEHDKTSVPAPVVTVFIVSDGRIALFKRSGRVRTYAGSWAGVSGYVERLPLDQAYVEMEEEAGLARSDVELQGMGVPVEVRDPRLGRDWLVFPFLFELRSGREITIDWESEAFEWVEPGELAARRTVPGLDRALSAVWPTFGDSEFWTALAEIATDTARSATTLGLSALGAVESLLRRDQTVSRERAARALAACRPSMGIFANLAARFLIDNPAEGELRTEIAKAAAESAARAAQVLANHETVITNTYSSIVKQALVARRATERPLHVVVMESRPGMEGVELARELACEGLRVSVITDAQAGLFAPRADAVLVGSDAITTDNMLQNKAGTSLLVMSARSHGVPCFGVTQTCKIVPAWFPSVLEEQEPDEVGRAEGVEFRNYAFDRTPLEAFEAVICENGVLTAEIVESVRARLGAASLT